MQEPLVMSARTVEEAIELALKELDVVLDEAEVEILSRGKAGFLGIGAELAPGEGYATGGQTGGGRDSSRGRTPRGWGTHCRVVSHCGRWAHS